MSSTSYDESLAAFDAAQTQLATTSTADLLKAAYALTHRIHAATLGLGTVEDTVNRRGLRQQRDMIDAEIERRCTRPHLVGLPGRGVSA